MLARWDAIVEILAVRYPTLRFGSFSLLFSRDEQKGDVLLALVVARGLFVLVIIYCKHLMKNMASDAPDDAEADYVESVEDLEPAMVQGCSASVRKQVAEDD